MLWGRLVSCYLRTTLLRFTQIYCEPKPSQKNRILRECRRWKRLLYIYIYICAYAESGFVAWSLLRFVAWSLSFSFDIYYIIIVIIFIIIIFIGMGKHLIFLYSYIVNMLNNVFWLLFFFSCVWQKGEMVKAKGLLLIWLVFQESRHSPDITVWHLGALKNIHWELTPCILFCTISLTPFVCVLIRLYIVYTTLAFITPSYRIWIISSRNMLIICDCFMVLFCIYIYSKL